MPKYVLDDKGILTIISEHDGGIFTLNDVLKKITAIMFAISIVSSIGLYVFFYYDAQTTSIATQYCISNALDYSRLYQLERIAKNCDLGYGSKKVYSKVETYPKYYRQAFEIVTARGYALISEIFYQIEQFRHRWR